MICWSVVLVACCCDVGDSADVVDDEGMDFVEVVVGGVVIAKRGFVIVVGDVVGGGIVGRVDVDAVDDCKR